MEIKDISIQGQGENATVLGWNSRFERVGEARQMRGRVWLRATTTDFA